MGLLDKYGPFPLYLSHQRSHAHNECSTMLEIKTHVPGLFLLLQVLNYLVERVKYGCRLCLDRISSIIISSSRTLDRFYHRRKVLDDVM